MPDCPSHCTTNVSDDERAHLAAAAGRRPLVEVLADVLEADRPFKLMQ